MSENQDSSFPIPLPADWRNRIAGNFGMFGLLITGAILVIGAITIYLECRVTIPSAQVAVLVHKTGEDLPFDMEIATDKRYKGVQLEVLKEGRVFLNPYEWEWNIVPQVEVPHGKIGVLIRLFGDDLAVGDLLATKETQKGIIPHVLMPGRYPEYSNRFAYDVKMFDPIVVPAGFVGVHTYLVGPIPKQPNLTLVNDGDRGVQKSPLQPGTYYLNPFERRISLVDCRTVKLNLGEKEEIGFPSKDGFWIHLDGYVQFHIKAERAPDVYVTYNKKENGDQLEEEVIDTIILPNARAFCRLAGARYNGRQFIDGTARGEFQKAFQERMTKACQPLGIHIEEASITTYSAPQPIADQLTRREIAQQTKGQYEREIEQQKTEAKKVTQTKKVEQSKRIVEAEREVVMLKTTAMQEMQVAVTKAEEELAVATKRLEAAQDKAAATVSQGKAAADVIRLQNEAEISGVKASVAAYDGNGYLFAQQVLWERIAPACRNIMTNSADSPILRIFDRIQSVPTTPQKNAPQVTQGAKQ